MSHPREGWSEGGARRGPRCRGGNSCCAPPAWRGPVPPSAASARCSGAIEEGVAGASTSSIPLPRPDKPVTWPIFSGNKAIASGLKPEKGATLKLYNWVAYINQAVVNNFAKKYSARSRSRPSTRWRRR